jgi:hypothetical protein
MSRWEVVIPYRDRSAKLDLAEVHDMASEALGAEEAATVLAVAAELFSRTDVRTYGDALDLVEAASPAQRRALLDRARDRRGLPSTFRQEQADEFARANANRGAGAGPPRDSQGRVELRCASPGCRAFEANREVPAVAGEVGFPARAAVKAWYCPQHREGREDHMAPYEGPTIGVSMSGAIRFPAEDEVERQRAETAAESRRRRYEVRAAERRREAEQAAEVQRHRDERMRAEMPKGLRP